LWTHGTRIKYRFDVCQATNGALIETY
jgi:hypothetical protein